MLEATPPVFEQRQATPLARVARHRRLLRQYSLAMLLAIVTALGLMASGPPAFADDTPAAATVNINTAGAEELASALKGVGQSRAEAIVRYREAYGPFAAIDELLEVKGIGQSTLDMNRRLIVLE